LYAEVRKNRFQRMNERFFDILRTIDPATGLFRADRLSVEGTRQDEREREAALRYIAVMHIDERKFRPRRYNAIDYVN